MSNVLRKHLTADSSHTIHMMLPPEMGSEVDVIVLPRVAGQVPQESLMMAQLMDESGFAQNILNSVEEDCWNDL